MLLLIISTLLEVSLFAIALHRYFGSGSHVRRAATVQGSSKSPLGDCVAFMNFSCDSIVSRTVEESSECTANEDAICAVYCTTLTIHIENGLDVLCRNALCEGLKRVEL